MTLPTVDLGDREFWAALDEIVRIGREAKIPVQVTHMKLAMKDWWGQSARFLGILDKARAEGIDLPGADLSHEELAVEVKPKQEDEFTCMSCFLVHHRSQLVDSKKMICKDCA